MLTLACSSTHCCCHAQQLDLRCLLNTMRVWQIRIDIDISGDCSHRLEQLEATAWLTHVHVCTAGPDCSWPTYTPHSIIRKQSGEQCVHEVWLTTHMYICDTQLMWHVVPVRGCNCTMHNDVWAYCPFAQTCVGPTPTSCQSHICYNCRAQPSAAIVTVGRQVLHNLQAVPQPLKR
jgi:hypothetical protein